MVSGLHRVLSVQGVVMCSKVYVRGRSSCECSVGEMGEGRKVVEENAKAGEKNVKRKSHRI